MPARPAGSPGRRPLPAGVTEADVSTLYDQYVKARSSVGETSDARTYDRLVRTLEQQAPKIMEEHRAKGVEFQVVVKDNQVVLRAKPKP
jgi:isocitrate dehydrogenase kinase/phosphatase